MNLFKKSKKSKPEKPAEPEPSVIPARPKQPKPAPTCSPPCVQCNAKGCCLSCDKADSITLEKSLANDPDLQKRFSAPYDEYSFWCQRDLQPSAFSTDPTRPLEAKRRVVRIGVPAFPDGEPCPFWRTKYMINTLTKERFSR